MSGAARAHSTRYRGFAAAAIVAALGGCAGVPRASSPGPEAGTSAPRIASEGAVKPAKSSIEAPSSPAAGPLVPASAAARAADNEPFELIPPGGPSGRGAPRRPNVTPIPLRLSSLPVASLGEPLRATDGNRAAFAAATAADDIVVRVTERPARAEYLQAVVATPKAAFSEIRVGTWVGWGGGPYERDAGPFITCGPQYEAFLPAHWETLAIRDGLAELTVTDGWFDQSACKAAFVRRKTVKAAPIFGGPLVFAFRSCGATCAEREDLTLIFPRANTLVSSALGGDAPRGVGSFSTVSLPIRRGGGGSMMAKIPGFEIQSFKKSAGLEASPPPPSARAEGAGAKRVAPAAPAPIEIVFGVEVSQSVEDPEPFAIAYIGPEGAMDLVSSLGVGHADLSLAPSPSAGPICTCQANDPLCSCF